MIKIDFRKIIIFLLCFVAPIVPYYFNVAGMNVTTYIYLGVIILWFSFYSGFCKIKDSLFQSFFLLNMVTCLLQIINNEVNKSVITLVTYFSFVLLITILRKDRNYEIAINYVIVAGVICSIFAIFESFTKINVFEILNTGHYAMNSQMRFGLRRVLSFTGQTINFGISRVFICSLILYKLTIDTNKKNRTKLIISYVIVLMSTILTLSRLAILVLFFSQGIILFKQGYKKFVKTLLFFSIFAFLIYTMILLVNPNATKIINNFFGSIASVFSDSVNVDESVWQGDNEDGIGDRVDLYKWVFEQMNGYYLCGHGDNSKFVYSYRLKDSLGYSYVRTKNSLEVQYLVWLYKEGIIGLFVNLLFIYKFVVYCFRNFKKGQHEKNLYMFNMIMFWTIIGYYVAFFGVNQASEKTLYNIMLAILISYNNKNSRTRKIDE